MRSCGQGADAVRAGTLVAVRIAVRATVSWVFAARVVVTARAVVSQGFGDRRNRQHSAGEDAAQLRHEGYEQCDAQQAEQTHPPAGGARRAARAKHPPSVGRGFDRSNQLSPTPGLREAGRVGSWFRNAEPGPYTPSRLAGAGSGSRRSASRNPTRGDRSVGRAGIRSRPRRRYMSRAARRRTSTATGRRRTSSSSPQLQSGWSNIVPLGRGSQALPIGAASIEPVVADAVGAAGLER